MAGETILTVTGNLVAGPELSFTTQRGTPVVRFRVASTAREREPGTGQWRDGHTVFVACQAWGPLAENIAESLTRGTRVIARGRFGQRSYQTGDGATRTVYELTVDEIAPSLRSAAG